MLRETLSAVVGALVGYRAGKRRFLAQDVIQKPLVGSYDIDNKKDYEKCFMLAQANIESAITLCAAYIDGDVKMEWPHASVILSQWYHAYELFYKAAILKGKSSFKQTHRIDKLTAEYDKIYTKSEFRVPAAFIVQDLTNPITDKEKKQSPQARAEHYNKLDQHFRYPFDKPGEPWDVIRGFGVESALQQLKESQVAFSRVIPLIIGK